MKRFVTTIDVHSYYNTIEIIYIQGRISGILYALCDYPNNTVSYFQCVKESCSGKTLTYSFMTECKLEEYRRFKDIAEKLYPGICTFDCKI